jgi:glycosyltransferase involved in cell wall biosynthesis
VTAPAGTAPAHAGIDAHAALSAGHDASLVTAVIPARDEAPSIADIIGRCRPFVAEVIVVDGHSRDDTARLATEAGARVVLDRGRGKGDAIRVVRDAIRTPVTVFIDADGSHVPEDIPSVAGPILRGDADHVSASRLMGGSSELHGGFDEFFRLMGSSFITACINWRFGVRLSESQNGFRAIRTDVLRRLPLIEDMTTIEQEMIIRTLRAGLRMAEVPSHEYPRLHGASHIVVWRVAPRYVYALVRHLFF